MPNTHISEPLERRAREIVDNLGGTWRRSKGMCRCPAHDDRTPSLSVSLGRHAILFHCFAGCLNEEVIAALARHGVRARELFDGSGGPLTETPREEVTDRNACRLWRCAGALRGSVAEAYLSKRALTQYSTDLRFHPETPLGPGDLVRFLPAMLAAVRTDLGVIAVHRTSWMYRLRASLASTGPSARWVACSTGLCVWRCRGEGAWGWPKASRPRCRQCRSSACRAG